MIEKPFFNIWWKYKWLALFVGFGLWGVQALSQQFSDAPEIKLYVGEPWEEMRKNSTAKIDAAIPDQIWFRVPEGISKLRFDDKKFGFVTPSAKFFTVGFTKGVVDGVRMSPQVEPLLLDDTMKVIMDLQRQWSEGGWTVTDQKMFPAIQDTLKWRERIRDINKGATTYWQAGSKYQVALMVAQFDDSKHPNEERYLITLAIAKPWVDPESSSPIEN